MNQEPETYEALLRQKRCVDLTVYYSLSLEELNQIYDFLTENPDGEVLGERDCLSLVVGNQVHSVISSSCCSDDIDALVFNNYLFRTVPHSDRL